MTTRRPGGVRSFAAVALILSALGLAGTAAASPSSPAKPPQATRLTGLLMEAHGDVFDSGLAAEGYHLHDAAGATVLLDDVDPAEARPLIGRQVALDAVAGARAARVVRGSMRPVAANGTGGGGGGTTTSAALAPGEKRVAVLLVNFLDDTRQPWTLAQATTTVFTGTSSVNAYYQDATDGQVTITGQVYGYYTVDKKGSTTCDYSSWSSQARTLATNAGVPLSNFQYFVYAWPNQAACSWAGLGQLPGSQSWIDGYLDTRVVGHELGHNFGVHHAASITCTEGGAPVVVSSSCSMSEYGDPMSIMGNTSRLHHNWHRAQLGFMPAESVHTATASGTFLLAPSDTVGGLRMLRIPRSAGEYLVLEFRQPTGLFDNFATTSPFVNGVVLRLAPETTSRVQSRLLDASPTSPASMSDPVLKPGSSFTDPVSGVTVSVLGVSASGAQVEIAYGADTVAPSAVTNLRSTSTSTVTLAWTAATDNRGVVGYRVARDGGELATVTSTTYVDATAVAGATHTYTVVALDAAGNASPPASVAVTVPLPDTTPPAPVTNLRASVAKNRQVSLTWNASSDNVGVTGYVVSRPGLSATVTTTSYKDKPGSGTITYTVQARDAAGNLSTPVSVTVVVR